MSQNQNAQPVYLSDLHVGQSAQVSHLDVPDELRHRLMALGMKTGKSLQVLRKAALGGPIHIRMDTTDLMLRLQQAACIQVVPQQ